MTDHTCLATSPESGVRCALPDNVLAHDAGHEHDRPGIGPISWATTAADLNRWADQFLAAYAARCGRTVDDLRARGRVVVPCGCEEQWCEGWQVLNGAEFAQDWRAFLAGHGPDPTRGTTDRYRLLLTATPYGRWNVHVDEHGCGCPRRGPYGLDPECQQPDHHDGHRYHGAANCPTAAELWSEIPEDQRPTLVALG